MIPENDKRTFILERKAEREQIKLEIQKLEEEIRNKDQELERLKESLVRAVTQAKNNS